jgi:hypothetical protein
MPSAPPAAATAQQPAHGTVPHGHAAGYGASERRRAPTWLSFVGVAAAAAVAAGALVSLRKPVSTVGTKPAQVVIAAAPSAQAPQAPRASAVAPPVAAAQAADAVDPSKLPRAPSGGSVPGAPSTLAANPAHATRAPSPGPSPAAPPANTQPAAEPAAPTGGGDKSDKSLEALMQQAAGSPASSLPVQPATAPGASPESATGSVPLRPSLGAINGAIGTAMPAARACLDADAPVSHASVTFNSDGSVGNVTITGWAAGKPAEACIRAALSKARVPPFAQPMYTVPATIRSN